MRILLDTNVIISALFFGGKPREILQSVVKKQHKAITSLILLSELSDVLAKKFGYTKQAILAVDQQIRKQCELVLPTESVDILNDVPDNRVLEAAVEGACDLIITGDKELRKLRKFRTIRIITPDEFVLEMMN